MTPAGPRPVASPDDDTGSGGVDALVRAAVAGDQAAFQSLYAAHAPRVHALALRLCSDAHEAGEVTQDTFVRVWQRLASFRNESAFGTWVHRIAVNTALEHMRTDRRRQARVLLSPPLALVSAADRGERLETRLARRLDLASALARLTPMARTVFVLREIEGHPYAELSELLDLSEVALRAQLSRARRSLMQLLAGEEDT